MDIENLVSQSVGSKLCYDTTWRRIARSSARLVWCEDRRESGSVGGQESRRARRLVSSVFSPQHNPPCGSKFGIRNILRKLVRRTKSWLQKSSYAIRSVGQLYFNDIIPPPFFSKGLVRE